MELHLALKELVALFALSTETSFKHEANNRKISRTGVACVDRQVQSTSFMLSAHIVVQALGEKR